MKNQQFFWKTPSLDEKELLFNHLTNLYNE
jgi:hypothetical protein